MGDNRFKRVLGLQCNETGEIYLEDEEITVIEDTANAPRTLTGRIADLKGTSMILDCSRPKRSEIQEVVYRRIIKIERPKPIPDDLPTL